MDTATKIATEFVGFRPVQTGGGCTALELEFRDDCYTLLTGIESLATPVTLSEPVHSGFYDDNELIQSSEYPTLLAALLDIYGPCDGEVLPVELQS